MKEWRPCKKIDPKYLEHVTCIDMLEEDPDNSFGDCINCICRKAVRNDDLRLAAIAVIISSLSLVFTVPVIFLEIFKK